MDKLFLQIINMSITSSYVILFVLIIRLLLKRAPKVFSYGLWSIVFLRLVFPFSFESIFSLIRINTKTIPGEIIYAQSPQINSGIVAIDRVVNNSLPVPTVAASINPIQIWIFLGQMIWLIGIGVLIIYTIYTTIRLSKRLKSAKLLHDNVYETNNIKTPFVFGVLNPKIYLPKDLSEIEMPYIIKHEQTHIKRYDHLIKFVAFLVLSVHWFNPLVWISFFFMSKDMELSCDERVIKEMGPKIKKDYSSSLLTLSTGRRIIGGSPLAFGENNTKGRIKNILNYRKPGFWVTLIGIIVIIVASIGLLSNPKEKLVNAKLPKNPWLAMVMIDGSLYNYTEKKLPNKINKVEIIGKIKSTVEHHEKPINDNQANFEIEGFKYGKYKDNVLILIDKEWVVFINEEHWNKGVSIQYDGALIKNIFGDLSDEERYDLLSWLSLEVQTDNNYQVNLDKIIEESFKYFGIRDSHNLDYAKSSLEITVSDRDSSIEKTAKELDELINKLKKDAKELEKQFDKQGLLVGYIVFDGNKLYLDEVEVIRTEDKDRIAELDLKDSDMPNGYYIHNPSNEKTKFELTDETSYAFTDYNLLFVEDPDGDRIYTTTNKEEFIQHLTTSYSDNPPAQKVPFYILVRDGKVINIIEEFLFTQ